MENNNQQQKTKSGFGIPDVLFVLFKHKWKIILLSTTGFIAAYVLYVKQEPLYASTAKLLIRYVRETGSLDPYAAIKSPGGGARGMGDPVVNTEIEIINSLDLALEVAESVGIEKLVPDMPNAALSDAAGMVLGGLIVLPGQSINVLNATYSNRNPELAKVVLEKIVELYFKSHLQIHRSSTGMDVVAKQAEEVKDRLHLTEAKLGELRTKAGIMNLSDANIAYSTQRAKTMEELMSARTELAELNIDVSNLEKTVTDEGNKTSVEPDAITKKRNVKTSDRPPSQVLTEYQSLMELLRFFQRRDVELRIKFREGNTLMALNQKQIDSCEKNKKTLLMKYPELAEEPVSKSGDSWNSRADAVSRKSRIAAIEAKIAVYNEHLKEIGVKFSEEYKTGAEIESLERQRQMEEAEYRTVAAELKNAEVNRTLDPARMPNITLIQQPSKPLKTINETTMKIVFGLAGGGMAAGLGLAFMLELLLDRRVKRPMEFQTRLQLPLLLSIPFVRRKERGRMLLDHTQRSMRVSETNEICITDRMSENLEGRNERIKTSHFIVPYSETIRDRIIFNFEVNDVTHKPKLIAVTSLSAGAGTSTIAAGVAKSFSEISGKKVLLVDLSSIHPEENPLFGEIPRHSLNGALKIASNSEFRKNPQNLYYASANARRDEFGLTTFCPIHLYELLPNLQASDYDYIVFDMPPIDETSRTLPMAGMMDKILLVLDAENTSRDGLQWGYSELVKGKADVSCIFNKTRSHIPAWLNTNM